MNSEGFREILGVSEGLKEDKESWCKFLRHLKDRGLDGLELVISDKTLGLMDSLPDFFPKAQWQRCVVHWYRNVLSEVPKRLTKDVAAMLKAIHAQEDRSAAEQKVTAVVEKLRGMKLNKAASAH